MWNAISLVQDSNSCRMGTSNDNRKKHDMICVFAFHHFRYILWRHCKPADVLWVHHLILAEFLLIWQSRFGCRWYLSFLKIFVARYFFLLLMIYDKNSLFLISYEKYRKSSSAACVIINPDIPLSVDMDMIDLLRWPRSRPQIWELFSSQNDQREDSELPHLRSYCQTPPTFFESTALSWNWHPNTQKSLYRSFRYECQLVHHAIYKFLEDRIAPWCHFPHKVGSNNPWLLQSRQNLKQILHIGKLIHLPFAIYIYICIYIYK